MNHPSSSRWHSHEFYRNAIVVGLDIGLRGIGVCVRKGRSIVYQKTLEFDLPQTDLLAGRRQKRAARHCRKNHKTRLHRLKLLFLKHGLPWPEEEALSRTDPFELRYRAVTGKLASKHAVAIAIRHCLLRRGYDFHANTRGEFPWGENARIKAAIAWIESTHITPDVAREMREILPSLTGKKANVDDPEVEWAEERALFRATLEAQVVKSEKTDISQLLAAYKAESGSRARKRMRNYNFHRSAVERHLRDIIERHEPLIEDVEGFTQALFLKPDPGDSPILQKRARERAIFHFNRKTRHEMEALWEKKTKDCPLAEAFNLPPGKAGTSADEDIRRWKLLEFLAFRRIDVAISTGKGAAKQKRDSSMLVSPGFIASMIGFVGRKDVPSWSDLKKELSADLASQVPGAVPIPATKAPANADFFDQLKDLVRPTAANLRQKASLAPHTAKHLYEVATDHGRSYDPALILSRLNAIEFYEKRKAVASNGPLYPQVRFLLGERAKKGKKIGQWLVTGMLQKIFREHSGDLDGATHPDYMVIECVGDAPRSEGRAQEIQREQKERREEREKRFAAAKLPDTGVSSTRRRLSLYEQQRGRCPFTGLELPLATDPALELEHLFPESRGGLSIDMNLALTFRWVNALKGNRTPKEFANSAGDSRILSWVDMQARAKDFKWGSRKKESDRLGKMDLFCFDGSGVPDFGNTTRTAQLARQLVAEAQQWMGIRHAEDARLRIGTPSGWLAAQARRTWARDEAGELLLKNRDEPQHHLVDAYVLAHIPPAEGVQPVQNGGIFFSQWETVTAPNGVQSRRPITQALPDLCPNFARDVVPLLGHDPETLPIYKHRPRKWARSIGDETFWKVDLKTGQTYQRTPLLRSSKDITDVDSVIKALERTRIPAGKIPARAVIERWLSRPEEDITPLLLSDGTPVRHVWKAGGKGSLKSPLGWSGVFKEGKTEAFFSLNTKSEALEIWLARTGKKWELIKRRKPDRTALRHLLKFAGPWRSIAPEWMQEKPEKPETHKTLEEIVCGAALPPVRKRVAQIRTGDTFRIEVKPDGSLAPGGQGKSSWWRVTAVKGDLSLEMKPLLALPESWEQKPVKKCGIASQLLNLKGINHCGDLNLLAASLELTAPIGADAPPQPGGQK